MADTYEGIPGHWPRYVLKRGLLHRRGRCGVYRDCFAVSLRYTVRDAPSDMKYATAEHGG